MTKDQDRARERRRWEKRERKLAERRAQSVRDKQAILAVVGVLVVVFGFVWLANVLSNRTDTPATPDTSATTQPTSDATTSAPPTVAPTLAAGCSAVPAIPTAQPTVSGQPDLAAAKGKSFVATMKTTCGDLTIALDGTAAPAAVSSFNLLAKDNYWVDTKCHRLVTQGIFVLQCGDPTGTGSGPGPGYHFGVENVPSNDVYPRGSLAMARKQGDPNSNGDQFFIVYKDTTLPKSADGSGYTLFGTVTSGMDIVDKIAAAGVNSGDQTSPLAPISILGVSVQPKA
ncbi:peptidylprolyl isomerase [Lapillicoccus sp.]|uniref:peptidylprolyl isomerase n=1 Tax=Lapillicoccus sp. TaxID=1909287 RepID=UPI003266220F